MKSLFYTILIIGGAFLGYDYFLAPPGQKIVFKSLNPPPKKKNAPAVPAPEANPVVVKTSSPPVKPVVVATPKPAAQTAAAPAPVKAAADPRFDPIEVLTGNWLKIPPSAFPREVKLLQDTEFKMSVGASRVGAGGKAFAISADKGMLTLAPTVTSPARALLPIDGTDLKAQLNEVYEKWKIVRAEELKLIAERKRSTATHVVAAATSSEADASGKPVRASDGTYPLLIASIRRGQVTEIKPEHISGWQDPVPAKIQGKDGWAVRVNYSANTIFGLMPVEAQALVVNGRVEGWFYTGSGEEVP